MTVTVTPVNDAPVAADDADTIAEDGSSTVDVLANDSDVDSSITVDSVTQGANGTVVDNGDGTVTYTPDADWNGTDTYTYTVTDGSLTDTATVTVTVTAVNDAPVAADDADSTPEDTAVTHDVLANDVDIDSSISVLSVTQGANGTVVDNGDGTVTYTPDADFNGTDTYTYTVTDGSLTDSATVTITVTAVNDAPVAADDAAATDEDTPIAIGVLANDTDVDLDTLVVSLVAQGSFGSVVDNGDGTVTYTPDPDANGADSFTYVVSDGSLTDTGTAVVTVNPVNDDPVALDDTTSMSWNQALVIAVLSNDSDVDADPLSVGMLGSPTNGSVIDNGDGTITYTPDTDWVGIEQFTYEVVDGQGGAATALVTVGVNNAVPDAVDDSITLDEDTSLTFDPVTPNDTDADGDPLSVIAVSTPLHGVATITAGGMITYVPHADYFGPDSFTYTVSDGALTDIATVTVDVLAVQDAPQPQADSVTVSEDQRVTVNVLANDQEVDGETLTVVLVDQPRHGTATINPNGTITYIPDADFNGSDSFSYTVSDGVETTTATVTVTVGRVNDRPIANDDLITTAEDTPVFVTALANDDDTDLDALKIIRVGSAANISTAIVASGTSVRVTPKPDFFGTVSFPYTISDGTSQATAYITVNVTAVNDLPVATPLTTSIPDTTLEGTAIGRVVASDVDSATLTFDGGNQYFSVDRSTGEIRLVGAVRPGSTINLPVRVSDGDGGAVLVTNRITVFLGPRAPIVSNRTIEVPLGTALGTVVGSMAASDANGDSVTWSMAPGDGWSIGRTSGQIFSGTLPELGGSLRVTVTATDETGLAGTGTLTIVVFDPNAGNRPPVAVTDRYEGFEDGSFFLEPAANDSDPDGDDLSVQILPGVRDGTIVAAGQNTFVFRPAKDWNGTQRLAYSLSDGRGGFTTGEMIVVVRPVNDAPIVGSVNAQVPAGDTLELPLPPIVEPDGDPYDVTVEGVEQAVVEVVGNALLFTSEAGFEGTASFDIVATDESGLRGVGLAVIEVVVGKASVSVDVLSNTDVDDVAEAPADQDTEEGIRPFLVNVLFPVVADALTAAWTMRAPIFLLLLLAAGSLLFSRKLHLELGHAPLPLADTPPRKWNAVLVSADEKLHVYDRPDHAGTVVARLDADHRGLEGTGSARQTAGIGWVEVAVDQDTTGWVEARHLSLDADEPIDMVHVLSTLERIAQSPTDPGPLEAVVSDRGLHVAHHARPFMIPRRAVSEAVKDPSEYAWWSPHSLEPNTFGTFSQMVIQSVLTALRNTAPDAGEPHPLDGEVMAQFVNFETIALGTVEDGWVLAFDRLPDGGARLVALLRRGVVNPLAADLAMV